MNRFTRLAWVLLSLLITPGAEGSTNNGLSVEARTTWATPAQPEVHLLLRNSTGEVIPFALWIGSMPGDEEIECAGTMQGIHPKPFTRFAYWNGISNGHSTGFVPPHGWAHRSLVLGVHGLLAPCNIPYKLVLLDDDGATREVIEGQIEVVDPLPFDRGEASERGVKSSAIVEKDERYDRRLIVRTLVENKEDHPLVVLVGSRTLECPEGVRAGWALSHATVQGEDVGPFQIRPGKWAVFVAAVDVLSDVGVERCRASFDLFADTPQGLRSLGPISFPLEKAARHGNGREKGGSTEPRRAEE